MTPEEDLEPLHNTVLVFSRARTSTFQNLSSWKQVADLVKRLNAALHRIGASHHRVELVRRGPVTYFVTCANSPRFNWNISLSHKDVGENLDYFAPGHMAMGIRGEVRTVYLIEKTSLVDMTGEFVITEYLDEDSRKQFHSFNQIREQLFNDAMVQLGLHYRFKCLVVESGMVNAVQQVMAQSTPPSVSWWQDTGYFVNGFLFPGVPQHTKFAFCDFDTKHVRYWTVLQSTFQFMLKYKRNEFWAIDSSLETGSSFWTSMENLCTRIRKTCATDLDQEGYDRFAEEIAKEFTRLGEWAEASKLTRSDCTSQHRPRPLSPYRYFIRRLVYRFWTIKERIYISLFDRRKLRTRLSRPMPASPASGDENACEHWLYFPSRK